MVETLRDIRGPLSLYPRPGALLLAAAIVLLAAVVFLYMFLQKRRKKAIIIKRPAHEIAYERLETLKRKDLIRQKRMKEYYSEISDIIRHYLGDRFYLKAPEMTTEEFLSYVRDYGQLVPGHKALLKEFLLSCDLVKFAKYAPSSFETDSIFLSARRFIDETKQETHLT